MMLYTPQGRPAPDRPSLHPLNALRNKAIAAAQTEVSFSLVIGMQKQSALLHLQPTTAALSAEAASHTLTWLQMGSGVQLDTTSKNHQIVHHVCLRCQMRPALRIVQCGSNTLC